MVITVMGILQTNGLPGFIVTPGDMTIAALSFNVAAILISFIGCIGAWKEYRCLLYTVSRQQFSNNSDLIMKISTPLYVALYQRYTLFFRSFSSCTQIKSV